MGLAGYSVGGGGGGGREFVDPNNLRFGQPSVLNVSRAGAVVAQGRLQSCAVA